MSANVLLFFSFNFKILELIIYRGTSFFLQICFILIDYLNFLLRFRFSIQNIARAIWVEKLREIER